MKHKHFILILLASLLLFSCLSFACSTVPSKEYNSGYSVTSGHDTYSYDEEADWDDEEADWDDEDVQEIIQAPTPTPTPKPTKTPRPTATPKPTKTPSNSSERSTNANYILNKNTHVFHYTSCSSVNQMKESNKIYFNGTREEAISQGYRPCQRCKP